MINKFKNRIKGYFLAGLLVLIPLGVTLYVIHFLISLMDKTIKLLPHFLRPETILHIHIPGLGIILILIITLFTGIMVKNYIGHKLVLYGELIVGYIPLVNTVYQGIKQLVEAIFTSRGQNFNRVILLEYPRKGIYTLGFVTGKVRGLLKHESLENMLNVFVPTTPNPTSGFYLLVPEKDVIDLDIRVEDAFKIIMSGGIFTPMSNNE